MEHIAPSIGVWEWVWMVPSMAGGRRPVPALGEHDASHHYTSSRDAQQRRARGGYKPSLAQTHV